MRYSITFTVLAAVLLIDAALMGSWAWLLAWAAMSFLIVAIAYAGAGPRLLGKRTDGSIAPWALLLHLPYFLLTWGVWHTQRRSSRAAAVHEVAPGLWVGRRLLPHELPAGVTLVVDLTGEFRELAGVRTGRTYVCLPTLDAMAPRPDELRRAVDIAAKWDGPVFMHCALGHGRTGMLAAAVLVARGVSPDVKSAIELLRAARPGIRLNPAQRRCVEALVANETP
jgi:protein-tyrosine phosphatase